MIDCTVVPATKPIRHSTGLSGSVVLSAKLVTAKTLIILQELLTIVTQEIYKAQVGVSNAHEEYLCRFIWSETESVSGMAISSPTHSI